MISAVHGKDTRALKEAADKTIIYGEQYDENFGHVLRFKDVLV